MNYTSIKRWLFCATILLISLLTTAQAAKLEEVFNGSMLGTTQRYFESVAGIPIRKLDDTYHFVVEGCNVQAFIKDEEVSALRLELRHNCQANLSSFGFNRSTRRLTFGYFTSGEYPEAQYAFDPSFYANCLKHCGNAFDPSVYAVWEGDDSRDFITVMLETTSGLGIELSHQWRNYMEQQGDYILGCEDRISYIATQAFENAEVEALTIGHNLFHFEPFKSLKSLCS